MKRICVFCGSSPGIQQDYIQAARLLGSTLAKRNITLVYGGAKVGIMGQLAKACLEAGGEVIGVITQDLVDMEVAFSELNQLFVVNSMHERKKRMSDMSDGFIALPGGLGTIEEFFEVLTWAQLGIHQNPCGILNTSHYYDKMIDFLNYSVEQKFLEIDHLNTIQIDEDPEELLKKFERYKAPQTNKAKWVLKMSDNIF
jgi:uncharacterized protein (TIGR00730 family)